MRPESVDLHDRLTRADARLASPAEPWGYPYPSSGGWHQQHGGQLHRSRAAADPPWLCAGPHLERHTLERRVAVRPPAAHRHLSGTIRRGAQAMRFSPTRPATPRTISTFVALAASAVLAGCGTGTTPTTGAPPASARRRGPQRPPNSHRVTKAPRSPGSSRPTTSRRAAGSRRQSARMFSGRTTTPATMR